MEKYYSSGEIINKIPKADVVWDEALINKMDEEIRKHMEEFDFQKRIKAAKSEQDLMKIIITV